MKQINKIIVLLLVILAGYFGYSLTKKVQSGSEEVKITQENPTPTQSQKPTPSFEKVLGDFSVADNEVCRENEKPLIYFFGSTSCPHCVWEKPVMKKVAEKFGKEIIYHENIDSQNDSEVFSRFREANPQGYIPFMVFGCKYFRTGSGESFGAKTEEDNLTSIICKLTDSKPNSVCAPLKDKISEIK